MKEKKNIWKEAEDWMEKQINLKKEFAKDFPNSWGKRRSRILTEEEIKKRFPDPTHDAKIIYVDNKGDVVLENIPIQTTGYMQVIPNSQVFTSIEQLLEYSKHTDAYLHQGIKNSIEQGYKLIK